MRRVTVLILLLVTCLAACGGKSSNGGTQKLRRSVAADLNGVFDAGRLQLVALSQLAVALGSDGAACSAEMARRLHGSPQYTAIGAVHKDGDLFCLSTPRSRPVNVSDRAYFQRSVAERGFAVGDYQLGRVTGKQTVVLAYPLRTRRGDEEGIVLAALDLDWLNRRLAAISRPAGTELVVIDSGGAVLARAPGSAGTVGRPLADRASFAFAAVPVTRGRIRVGTRHRG